LELLELAFVFNSLILAGMFSSLLRLMLQRPSFSQRCQAGIGFITWFCLFVALFSAVWLEGN